LTSFSQILRREADPVWRRILGHSFLLEAAEGTLPLEKFQYYLKQDHAYLFEYCRFLGLAASRSESLGHIRFFSEVLRSEFEFEIEMQRSLAAAIGLDAEELTGAVMAPTTKAYTSFLIKVAATEDLGGALAALSPCPLSYVEIAARLAPSSREAVAGGLASRGSLDGAYDKWFMAYSSKESVEVCDRLRGLLDEVGEAVSASQRARMVRNFLDASRYEYMFWNMAYTMEAWPV
jgi:thiaminase/transcriptional activator TenA